MKDNGIKPPSGMNDDGRLKLEDSWDTVLDKILESDVIIYDIQDCFFDEVEYVLKSKLHS